MTVLLQRVGSRVPQNFTLDQALRAHLSVVGDMYDTNRFVRAMFTVLTESQQVRVLEEVGWVRCPGPAIEAAPAHHPV